MAEEKRKKSGGQGFTINQRNVEEVIRRKIPETMTQNEWAKQMELDRTTLYHMLQGKRVSPETIVRLSLFLEEPLENLVEKPEDVLKIMRKTLTDDIGRMGDEEIRAVWTLLLPFRTKKKGLRGYLKESRDSRQHPFKVLMYLLTGEDHKLRQEISCWIRNSAQTEFLINRKVIKEFYEEMEGRFGTKVRKCSA